MSAASEAIQPRALPEVEAAGLRMTLDRGAGQWGVERVDSGTAIARILLPWLTDEHGAAYLASMGSRLEGLSLLPGVSHFCPDAIVVARRR